MIYTSYFAKLKKFPKNIIPISICGKAPVWYDGAQYKKLAPSYDIFMKWKQDQDNDCYTRRFQAEVLGRLSVEQVLDELQLMASKEIKEEMQLPIYENPNWHIVLICYEKPSDFCHRHLVADWLSENGCKCDEIIL